MPVRYTPESEGPSTRRDAAPGGPVENENYYKDITTTGAAADLAQELGIDLSDVKGTGLHGKVTKADVENHVKSD